MDYNMFTRQQKSAALTQKKVLGNPQNKAFADANQQKSGELPNNKIHSETAMFPEHFYGGGGLTRPPNGVSNMNDDYYNQQQQYYNKPQRIPTQHFGQQKGTAPYPTNQNQQANDFYQQQQEQDNMELDHQYVDPQAGYFDYGQHGQQFQQAPPAAQGAATAGHEGFNNRAFPQMNSMLAPHHQQQNMYSFQPNNYYEEGDYGGMYNPNNKQQYYHNSNYQPPLQYQQPHAQNDHWYDPHHQQYVHPHQGTTMNNARNQQPFHHQQGFFFQQDYHGPQMRPTGNGLFNTGWVDQVMEYYPTNMVVVGGKLVNKNIVFDKKVLPPDSSRYNRGIIGEFGIGDYAREPIPSLQIQRWSKNLIPDISEFSKSEKSIELRNRRSSKKKEEQQSNASQDIIEKLKSKQSTEERKIITKTKSHDDLRSNGNLRVDEDILKKSSKGKPGSRATVSVNSLSLRMQTSSKKQQVSPLNKKAQETQVVQKKEKVEVKNLTQGQGTIQKFEKTQQPQQTKPQPAKNEPVQPKLAEPKKDKKETKAPGQANKLAQAKTEKLPGKQAQESQQQLDRVQENRIVEEKGEGEESAKNKTYRREELVSQLIEMLNTGRIKFGSEEIFMKFDHDLNKEVKYVRVEILPYQNNDHFISIKPDAFASKDPNYQAEERRKRAVNAPEIPNPHPSNSKSLPQLNNPIQQIGFGNLPGEAQAIQNLNPSKERTSQGTNLQQIRSLTQIQTGIQYSNEPMQLLRRAGADAGKEQVDNRQQAATIAHQYKDPRIQHQQPSSGMAAQMNPGLQNNREPESLPKNNQEPSMEQLSLIEQAMHKTLTGKLQRQIKKLSEEEKIQVFKQLKPSLPELLTDMHARYVIVLFLKTSKLYGNTQISLRSWTR